MKRSLVIVTDGSAEADVLASWLAARRSDAIVCAALGAADVEVIADARRGAGQRVVVLAEDATSDVAAAASLEQVRAWLADLGPFERRMRGLEVVEARVGSAQSGAAELERLAHRLALPGARKSPARAPSKGRRGRPRGSDPFRGASLDVCVRLLLEPDRTWTERQLADATARSPHAVHRALAQLSERGYVATPRGAARLTRADALRDDAASAWALRVSSKRVARGFAAPRSMGPRDIMELVEQRGGEALLAGPTALEGASGLRGGATVLYADERADAVLREASFRSVRGAADVVLWPIDFEPAVRASPREVEGLPATNAIITYFDLAASGIDRHVEAARAVWEQHVRDA